MRRLSIVVIAVASTVALTQIASAADLPRKAPTHLAPSALVYSWTGFYVGLNVGYGWADPSTDIAGTDAVITGVGVGGGSGFPSNGSFAASHKAHLDGVIGGVQLGYNYQLSSQFVAGFETDIQLADQKGSGAPNDPFSQPVCTVIAAVTQTCEGTAPLNGTATTVYEAKIRWFGTARGRLGVLFNDILFYGTGGLAYGGVSISAVTTVSGTFLPNFPVIPASTAFSNSKTNVGFSVGAGMEGKLTSWRLPNWSWKVEYLYLDLGSVDTAGPFPPAVLSNFFLASPSLSGSLTTHTHFTDNIVRVGLNYKFD